LKNIKIPYGQRLAAIILLSFLAAAAAAALILFGIIGIKKEKSVQTASYYSKSEIKYNLNLLDDPLYNRNNLEIENMYITKYLNNVDMNLLYKFSSDKAMDFHGDYNVAALLEAAYSASSSNSKTSSSNAPNGNSSVIWKKSFQLIPQTEFSGGQVGQKISLPIKDYIDLIKNIQQSTNVSTSVNLTVTYTVNYTAVIDGSPISDTSVSTLILPISESVLVITGNPVSEQTKAVNSTVPQEILPKTELLIVSIVLLVLFIGSLLYMLFATVGLRPAPSELKINKILKKYGSRIVELRSDEGISGPDAVDVRTFEDLLLIADEMKKPILKNSGTGFTDMEFYVFDKLTYIFRARFLINEASKAAVGETLSAGL